MSTDNGPSRIRSFRDLIAWQKAMELAKSVYLMTALLPADERFGLTAQMRRAAVSIPSNIAEGYGRGGARSGADFIRFLRQARGSLAELDTQIELTRELFPAVQTEASRDLLEETGRVLQGLIRSLQECQ